jgi:hypothetical protein
MTLYFDQEEKKTKVLRKYIILRKKKEKIKD